jgi:purine-binding chemotaxis protein CheW
MENSNQDTILEELLLETQEELAEIDFSALLDFPAKQPVPEGDKYLVFHLDENTYGIDSKRVEEVSLSLPVTPLPNVPEWLLGLANLRGDLISVVDLRKLWKKNTEPPNKTRFIIVRSPKHETSIAFMVDRLNEIVTLSAKEINFSAADFGDSYPTFFGKAEFKAQPLFLLEIDKILSALNTAEVKAV